MMLLQREVYNVCYTVWTYTVCNGLFLYIIKENILFAIKLK